MESLEKQASAKIINNNNNNKNCNLIFIFIAIYCFDFEAFSIIFLLLHDRVSAYC